MIVSASYRTDIPAFYAPWFENRFRAGYAMVANPYGGPPLRVGLRDGVDGFVFWTRNAAPFANALSMVRAQSLPFVVSHTLTGYPRALEISVIEPGRAVDNMRALAETHGRRALVWRYDPIVFSSLTTPDFHRRTFAGLAQALAGIVDECVISFATIYKKTARNMDGAARAENFTWEDPDEWVKWQLAEELANMAKAHSIRLSICSQEGLGVEPARCIDARRLEDVAAGWGSPRQIVARVKGNRPDCACHESRDIGVYDSCPHGCAYCYAVNSRSLAKRRFAQHDPAGEYLIPPATRDDTETLLV